MVGKIQGACLLLLLAAAAMLLAEVNGHQDRGLLQSSASFKSRTSASTNKPKSKAVARSNISVSQGEGTAIATSSADAFAEKVSGIKEVVARSVKRIPKKKKKQSTKKYCKKVAVSLERSAVSIAEIGAEASVSTLATVVIDGIGEGCALAEGEAEAKAESFASALVEAFVEAKGGRSKKATAEADIKAFVRVMAVASANAASSACIKADGSQKGPSFAEAFQDVLATAYVKGVASILVWLEAAVDCSGTGDSFVDAEAEARITEQDTTVTGTSGSTVVGGPGSADTTAGGKAVVDKSKPCSKNRDLAKCCRGKNILAGQANCFCNAFGRSFSRDACTATKEEISGTIFWQYTLTSNAEKGTCNC